MTFSQLPISSSSSHSGRRMINNRRGLFPISEYWIHAIPVIVFLCFFTLWCVSHSVNVDMSDGEIMSVHRLDKSSMAVRNESHVSLAILASSAVSPISTNQNLTAHHNVTTQPHNATALSLNETQSEIIPKQRLSPEEKVRIMNNPKM